MEMKLRQPTLNLRFRAKAAAIHAIVCAVVAAAAAFLVFVLWYPWPYRLMSDGQGLFILLTSVDLVLGPLLTFAVFDQVKGWRHLRRDLIVIGVLQLIALTYGLHMVYLVRPVALVYEEDRFRVISAADVYSPELPGAPPAYRQLPLNGPWLLGTRNYRNAAEREDALALSLGGIDNGQRPSFWRPYPQSQTDALAHSRPIALLIKHYPTGQATIEASLRKASLSADEARFVPVRARSDWVVLLNRNGDVVGFAPFDGFF